MLRLSECLKTGPLSAGVLYACLAVVGGCSSKSTDPVPTPNPVAPRDSVIITGDTVSAGDTAEVEFVLSNPDSAVAGINIWLESAPGILYDTAEALWPRFPVGGMTWTSQRHDSIQAVSLLMVDFIRPLDYVSPGRGPLFKVRFVVSATQAPGTYALDTTKVILPRGVDISYRSGTLVPAVGFLAGQIVVQ